MEQNYSYNQLPSTGPLNHQSHQQAPAPNSPPPPQGGMSSPRTLQPLPPLTSAPQPYTQAPPSQYPQPSYGNSFEYRPATEPHYTHQAPMALPSMSSPIAPIAQGYGPPPTMDTTGQIAPPGMRPRLTTSVFEEEGSLCFQVDVDGICVARREDNHMINGTKLLNVARMTRGRRDGILKAEKQKTVVKIGPMHLKGVWIPFERALLLANQEKITELLYPLFVHNIGNLLYHPTNVARPLPLPNAYPQRPQAHLPSIQYVEVNEGLQSNQRT